MALHPSAFFRQERTFTILSGTDAKENLERLTANSMSNLDQLSNQIAIFCDLNGRIIDLPNVTVIDSQILLISSAAHGEIIRTKVHSGASWKDDIIVQNGDGNLGLITLFGIHINRTLFGLGINPESISSTHWTEFDTTLLRRNQSDSIEIIYQKTNESELILALQDNGAVEVKTQNWDSHRMKHLILEDEVNGLLPHEVGIEQLIDTKKGCYPGQEIHARMASRESTSKKVVRFSTTGNCENEKIRLDDGTRFTILSKVNDAETLGIGLIHPEDIAANHSLNGEQFIIQ